MMNRILPIVLVLISAGIGFLYIYPTYTNTIQAAQQQIASYNSALAAAATFSQKESQLVNESNAISPSDLDRLQTFLPDGVNNIQLILDMDALASRYGITLSGFTIANNANDATSNASTPSPVAASSSPDQSVSVNSATQTDSLDLSVTATGTYNEFIAFLTAAEQSERPLDVTKLTLTDSGTGVYTYAMTFRIYWLQ